MVVALTVVSLPSFIRKKIDRKKIVTHGNLLSELNRLENSHKEKSWFNRDNSSFHNKSSGKNFRAVIIVIVLSENLARFVRKKVSKVMCILRVNVIIIKYRIKSIIKICIGELKL